MDNNNGNGKKEKPMTIGNEKKINPIPFPFSTSSETIAKFMIDKLISLSITHSFIVHLEERISDDCIDFTCRILTGYLSSAFISYEKDDFKPIQEMTEEIPNFDMEEIEKKEQTETEEALNDKLSFHDNTLEGHKLHFSNYYRGENDWNILPEPGTAEIDRYASTYVGMAKDLKEQNQKEADVNYKSVVNESKVSVMRKTTTQYLKKPNFNKEKEKTRRRLSIEINNADIPREEFMFEDPNDLVIFELRKEMDDEIKNQEEEKKKILIKQIEIQEKFKESQNIQKEYENKKITIDANGKIVFIRQYPNDRLATEFITPRTDYKEIIRRKSITKMKDKNKDKVAIERESNPNLIHLEPTKEEKEKPQDKDKDRDKKATPIVPVPQSKDNKKKELLLPNQQSKEDPFLSTMAALEKKMERGPITPCGSCFDKISLEIGVAFTEEKQYKTGGKNYLRAFNKYSIDSYNQQVKDNLGMQTLPNQTYRTLSEYNNYTPIYNKTEPSQFNNTSTSHDKYKAYETQSRMTMTDHSSINPFIKTNRLNLPSLSSAIDYLDLTRGRFDNVENNYPLPENIFKAKMEKKSNTNRKLLLDPITNFTASLLTQDNWGVSSNIVGYTKQSQKLSRKFNKPKKDLASEFKNRVPHKQLQLSIEQNALYSSMDNFSHHNKLTKIINQKVIK